MHQYGLWIVVDFITSGQQTVVFDPSEIGSPVLTSNANSQHRAMRRFGLFCFPQSQKISHDVASGVIQMTVDHFTKANEGTYTVQIHDGKAKNQTSLVLVGDGTILNHIISSPYLALLQKKTAQTTA